MSAKGTVPVLAECRCQQQHEHDTGAAVVAKRVRARAFSERKRTQTGEWEIHPGTGHPGNKAEGT